MALIGVPQVQRIRKFFSEFKGHDGAAATPGSAGSPRFCWFFPVRMDMSLAGCRGHRSCGQPLVVAHVAAGLQHGEATGQVGRQCMVAGVVNRHENRGSQQHHRPAMMGRQCVAGA